MPHKIPESVLVVIHSPEGEVLLIERADHPGFWQSVTGSKDSLEESPMDTAVREVMEETGLHTGPPHVLRDLNHHIQYEIFEHWRWRYAPGVTHNTEHWFSLCVPRDVEVRLAPREHLRYEWLPWEDAAQRCFSWSNCDAIRWLMTQTKN